MEGRGGGEVASCRLVSPNSIQEQLKLVVVCFKNRIKIVIRLCVVIY